MSGPLVVDLAQQQQRTIMGDRWQENNLIFPTTHGTPLDLHNLLKDFKDTLRKGGLPEIRFHDLRHTAASIMLQQNIHLIECKNDWGTLISALH